MFRKSIAMLAAVAVLAAPMAAGAKPRPAPAPKAQPVASAPHVPVLGVLAAAAAVIFLAGAHGR